MERFHLGHLKEGLMGRLGGSNCKHTQCDFKFFLSLVFNTCLVRH